MRLSEAIRIGATYRPQCTGVSIYNGQSCAIGAAYEGYMGKLPPTIDHDPLEKASSVVVGRWCEDQGLSKYTLSDDLPRAFCPISNTPLENCPDNIDHMIGSLFDTIVHLNDDHKLSREAIADIVEEWGY